MRSLRHNRLGFVSAWRFFQSEILFEIRKNQIFRKSRKWRENKVGWVYIEVIRVKQFDTPFISNDEVSLAKAMSSR